MSIQNDLAATALRVLAEFVEANPFLTDVSLARYPGDLRIWVRAGDRTRSFQWFWTELDACATPEELVRSRIELVVQDLAIKTGES